MEAPAGEPVRPRAQSEEMFENDPSYFAVDKPANQVSSNLFRDPTRDTGRGTFSRLLPPGETAHVTVSGARSSRAFIWKAVCLPVSVRPLCIKV